MQERAVAFGNPISTPGHHQLCSEYCSNAAIHSSATSKAAIDPRVLDFLPGRPLCSGLPRLNKGLPDMIRAAKLAELTLKKAVLPFIAATPKIASGAADTIGYLLRISKHSSTKSG